MGGDGSHWAQTSGPRYAYPKWVYSSVGGWWADPKYWRRNTLGVIAAVFIPGNLLICYLSTRLEEHHRPPTRWLPSMLWAREFKEGGKWAEEAKKFK